MHRLRSFVVQEVLERLVVPYHDAVGIGDRRIVRPVNESAARELEILPVLPVEHRVGAGVAMRPPGMGGRPVGHGHAPAGLYPTKWVGRRKPWSMTRCFRVLLSRRCFAISSPTASTSFS